jgi:hypothetical protein
MSTNPITHIINNILPKEDKDLPWDEYAHGYTQALADCHAKLPEILDYVYAELRKEVEKILPGEMTLGRENPFLKIMYDHAPNNAKFYEANVEKINNFRNQVLSLLSTNQK